LKDIQIDLTIATQNLVKSLGALSDIVKNDTTSDPTVKFLSLGTGILLIIADTEWTIFDKYGEIKFPLQEQIEWNESVSETFYLLLRIQYCMCLYHIGRLTSNLLIFCEKVKWKKSKDCMAQGSLMND
jgi:hypothetical protein